MAHALFVPLRIFSCFTMLDGAIEPKAIAKLAKERKFPAAAICDRNGLYGSPIFAGAAKSAGVQPIIGTFLAIARPDAPAQARDLPIDWLALFAQDEAGWQNLCRHVSRAHLDRPLQLDPHVALDSLRGYTDGLICLTGGNEGALARLYAAGRHEQAERYCDTLQSLFGDRLYIEITRTGEPEEDESEEDLIALAYSRDIPLVASNPAQFADKAFHSAHDALLCIANSTQIDAPDRPRSSSERWVKPAADMAQLFADLPEALANTLVVAQRCAFAPPRRKPLLPSLAGDREGEARMLATDARVGLAQRLALYWPEVTEQELADAMACTGDARLTAYEGLREKGVTEDFLQYAERLDFEVQIIVGMGFPGYFLIVADFIKWANENGIPVGPGRGSGAGSVVAWALTITGLDPLKLGLLFERFLNPERVSMPDFDIDFCETRRGEVIRYVQKKYGHDHVAQIITFGKMKARAVLRDCGRILQMSYGRVDSLCKMVPNHPTDPWTLTETIQGRKAHGVTKDGPIPEFRREYDTDPEVRRLVDLAVRLEGLPRNSSTHAAGVVIGDRPLAQLVPLYRDPRSDMPVTQFDMKYVEDTGLVKFDFLGLKTLSVLHKAGELLARRGIAINLATLGWDDPAVYELLKRGDTVGVFQLESEGMRRTLAAVKPTNFGDIIALVSLYRPGPMDNIPLFGRRKNGLEAIEYPHEKLAGILSETYGIFVYQEQVMQAAQILAGYSLGDADLLRRAMGKKVQAEMDMQRQRFVDGCLTVSGIAAPKANELFDLIDKFAGYGFNKSHAAAYALLAYHTAWFKAHYPHEFYAAAMCFDMHQSEKLAIFVDDARRNGIELAPPDINRSEAEFIVEETAESHAVRYALAGIRNVGEKAMDAIVAERAANGPFESLDDVFRRAPAGAMNRRQLESLGAAGAFDTLEPNRAKVLANADTLLAEADRAARERQSSQAGLFGGEDHVEQGLRLVDAEPWSRADQMAKERENFGFYFAAHPVEQYRVVATANGARTYASLMTGGGGGRAGAVMAAMVESVQKRKTRKGKDFVVAEFSDQSGNFSASCFEESLVEQFVRWAREGTCILLNVELDSPSTDEPPRVTVRGGRPLSEVKNNARMVLTLDIDRVEAVQELALLMRPGAPGAGEVIATLHLGEGRTQKMRLGRDFALDGDFAEHLAGIAGIENVSLTAKRGPEGMALAA
ncbi:DNA polymerase III subunit alpha [Novosphingobium sp. Leaf2]|uniref:DNA polymerase III subunit alpha n=1 Tax=Novosphingobium sp. Leaf2 TaxID=1735670 RepID=UPI0006F3755E|nr:DNA polymerase III subunit alpha [Novosphingobium sp. Leaf2]KQM18830.1 DNA polymerase III subunit alpha [Novosphingobium sp. Leaf2]